MSLPEIIKRENNPEILRAFLSHLIEHNKDLEKRIDTLLLERSQKTQLVLNLDDELSVLRKRMFGKSSEKRSQSRLRDKDHKQLSLHSESLVPPPNEKELAQLTEVHVDHELSELELSDIAEQYGFPRDSEWECLNGFYDESEELDIRVESYIRKKHRRFKYRLKLTKSKGCCLVRSPYDKSGAIISDCFHIRGQVP